MDSGPSELLDAQTVSHVKHFERLTSGSVIESPIRQRAIHIENQQAYRGRGLLYPQLRQRLRGRGRAR